MRESFLSSDKMSIKLYLKNTVGIIIVINLFLAVIVLLKDIFLAAYLGTSANADALILAYFLPDTVGNNLFGAAMGVACIPVFSRLYINNQFDRLKKVIVQTIIIFFAIAFILIMTLYLFKDGIIGNLGEGFSPDIALLCLGLYKIILPTVLIFPIIFIGTSILQVYEKFSIPAFAPVVFNLVFLSSILSVFMFKVPVSQGVYVLALAILVGVFLMAVMISFYLKRSLPNLIGMTSFFSKENIFPKGHTDIKDILVLLVPYLVILLSSQGVLYFERFIASHLTEGSIAGLNYAYRLSQFPIWTFVLALIAVVFPSMSKDSGSGAEENFNYTMEKAVKIIFLVILPLSFCLFILRVPIIYILLHRGAFDHNSLEITSGILAGYSLSLVWQSIVLISIRVFLAKHRILLPMLASIISALINIIADYYLVSRFGSKGLGFGAALGSAINAILLAIMINKEYGFSIKGQCIYLFRVILANIPLCLLLMMMETWWSMQTEIGMGFVLIYVLSVCFSGGIIYFFSIRGFNLWPWTQRRNII